MGLERRRNKRVYGSRREEKETAAIWNEVTLKFAAPALAQPVTPSDAAWQDRCKMRKVRLPCHLTTFNRPFRVMNAMKSVELSERANVHNTQIDLHG